MKTALIVVGAILILTGGAVLFINDRSIANGYAAVFLSFDGTALLIASGFVSIGAILVSYALLSNRR
jgi:hypothetical protein